MGFRGVYRQSPQLLSNVCDLKKAIKKLFRSFFVLATVASFRSFYPQPLAEFKNFEECCIAKFLEKFVEIALKSTVGTNKHKL